MIFLENCFIAIDNELCGEFCIQQASKNIKVYNKKQYTCLELQKLQPDLKNSSQLIWKFSCEKCQIDIHFLHNENSTQKQRENNLQKLTDLGLKLTWQEDSKLCESQFNFESTQNLSQLYLFETSKNQTNTNSLFVKQHMNAFSSLRFHPEEELIQKSNHDVHCENQHNVQNIQIQNSSCFQDDDFNLTQIISSQAQKNSKVQKKRNTLVKILDIFKIKQEFVEQNEQKEIPICIKNISDYFKIDFLFSHPRTNVYRDYEDVLQSQIESEIQYSCDFQKLSSTNLITQNNKNQSVFFEEKDQIKDQSDLQQDIKVVVLQDRTIQVMIKINQMIATKAIADYQQKKVNELFYEYTNEGKINEFRFSVDMIFLTQQYFQWTFSSQINQRFFSKFWQIHQQARQSLQDLIIYYFSYKNKKIIINKFFVFIAKIFIKEIEQQIQIFTNLIYQFTNFIGDNILQDSKIDYNIVQNIAEYQDMRIDIEILKSSQQDLENFLTRVKDKFFKDLIFIQSELQKELERLQFNFCVQSNKY